MQINSVNSSPYFTGSNPKRAARHIGQVMNKLYENAYQNLNSRPDMIQVTAKLKNGKEISAIADFYRGRYVGIRLPYEDVPYKSEFCKTVIEKYNNVVTKGKAYK